jgi:hypothetical protein
MASNVTRDHHNLRRNLKLNGKYISNDGGNEGILIDDAGKVRVSGDLDIASNMTIDDNEIDVSSGDFTIDTNANIILDVCGSGGTGIYFNKGATKHLLFIMSTLNETTIRAHDGASFEPLRLEGTELELNAVSGDIVFTSGLTNVSQLTLDMDGTSGEQILQLRVDTDDLVFKQYDGNEVLRIADDRKLYFYDKGGEHISSDGTDLTIASGADIALSAGADINIPADIGLTFGDDGGKIEGNGTDLTIVSSADIVLEAGSDITLDAATDITLDAEGDIELNANGGDIVLKDHTATFAPTAANHAATKEYVDSVMYDHRVCNYNSSSSLIQFVPLAGYIFEGALTNANEYRAMVMPYDGSLIRIIWRSEIEQTSGTFGIQMLISDDGTEIPTTTNFLTRVASFTLAANTTYVHDPGVTAAYHPSGNESNAFSKGQIIAVGIDPTVAPNDTNCTLVFKYDTST